MAESRSSGGGPHPPTPAHYKFCSRPTSSAVPHRSPDLTLLTSLHFLQFLALSLGSLEGLRMAIQGLRKGCHSSHHSAQLPGLNLASESLQEAVGVPADLLDPQVYLLRAPCSSKGGPLATRAAAMASGSPPPGQGQGTSPKRQSLPLPAPLGCSALGPALAGSSTRSPGASGALLARLSRSSSSLARARSWKSRCSSCCCRQL